MICHFVVVVVHLGKHEQQFSPSWMLRRCVKQSQVLSMKTLPGVKWRRFILSKTTYRVSWMLHWKEIYTTDSYLCGLYKHIFRFISTLSASACLACAPQPPTHPPSSGCQSFQRAMRRHVEGSLMRIKPQSIAAWTCQSNKQPSAFLEVTHLLLRDCCWATNTNDTFPTPSLPLILSQ